MLDLPALMTELAKSRPVFHSEADFQHSLAWLIQTHHPTAGIRLEVPAFAGTRDRLDVQVRLDGAVIPVELKYWQARIHHVADGDEAFRLVDQAAEDVGRAAFVKDIARVEQLVLPPGRGWVVALTNSARYWTAGRLDTSDAAFRIHEGATLSGSPLWRVGTSATTMKGTEALTLRSAYACRWRDYSSLGEGPNTRLRYLALEVA